MFARPLYLVAFVQSASRGRARIAATHHTILTHTLTMTVKRTLSGSSLVSSPKRIKTESASPTPPPSERDAVEYPNWPAPRQAIEAARSFILSCAKSSKPTLLVPDRDCDGLSSGNILRQTLIALGKPKDKIGVHFVERGSNVHTDSERKILEEDELNGEAYDTVIVLDQGSGSGHEIARGKPTLVSADLLIQALKVRLLITVRPDY
jgi:hypothetical protein